MSVAFCEIGKDAPSACLPPRLENSHRLVSLWDILERFDLLRFANLIAVLTDAQHKCVDMRDVRGDVDRDWIKRIGEDSQAYCRKAGFTESARVANFMSLRAKEKTPRWDVSHIQTELLHLQEAIESELQTHVFLNILPNRVGYVDKNSLFGEDVLNAFPSARSDISDAGNCLAVGLGTSTVFHLMRAAEYALRALAYDRRIKVPNRQLEFATWDEIIKELEGAEKAIQNYPKTLAREAQFNFYHGAMMQFRAFKNKFRNQVMHTRDHYDVDEAKSAMDHVEGFMKILSKKIGEGKRRTPKIWKKHDMIEI